MTTSKLPKVGFDRFIPLDWANYALILAMMNKPADELRSWLDERIEGKESARKTTNVLVNIWFKEYEQTKDLRARALDFVRAEPGSSRKIFHWGMCLANFPLFWNTANTIGRLIRIQEDFQKSEVKSRLAEQYHNQATINRGVRRILQSLLNWTVISKTKDGRLKNEEKIMVRDNEVLVWLYESALITSHIQPINLIDFIHHPVFFPFQITNQGIDVLRNSDAFILHREGLENDVVRLS